MNSTPGVKFLKTKLHRGKEFDICPKKSVTIISQVKVVWFKAKTCKLCCIVELMQTTVHFLPSCTFEQKEGHKVQGTQIHLSSNSYYMPCIVAKLKEQRKEFLFFAFHNNFSLILNGLHSCILFFLVMTLPYHHGKRFASDPPFFLASLLQN